MRIGLGTPLTLSEIASALGASAKKGFEDRIIEHLTTDTRELFEGDLFLPLSSERCDAEQFVPDAIGKGALVISKKEPSAHIKCSEDKEPLKELAKYYRKTKLCPKHTVAITGSVGKTTTKEFLAAICKGFLKVHSTKGNFNNLIGVPLSILSAPKETEMLILELGMNSLGEISELSKTAHPDIAVITKIGSAHIGRLGSRENIAKAKLEIIDGMIGGTLIVPYGEPLLCGYPSVNFSAKDPMSDYYLCKNKDDFSAFYKGEIMFNFDFAPEGEQNLECLSAAVCAASTLGLDHEKIIEGISLISDDNIRQRLVKIKGLYILDDSYNASEESIESAIKMVSGSSDHPRKSAVFGTVLELGEYSETIHERIGALAASGDLFHLYFIGEGADAMARGALNRGFPPERLAVIGGTDYLRRAAELIKSDSVKDELILIKGSHKLGLSGIISELEKIFGGTKNV